MGTIKITREVDTVLLVTSPDLLDFVDLTLIIDPCVSGEFESTSSTGDSHDGMCVQILSLRFVRPFQLH